MAVPWKATGKDPLTIKEESLYDAVTSKNGEFFAVVNSDKSNCALYRSSNLECLGNYEGLKYRRMRFSPDNKYFVILSRNDDSEKNYDVQVINLSDGTAKGEARFKVENIPEPRHVEISADAHKELYIC